jgi:hypothetical protein
MNQPEQASTVFSRMFFGIVLALAGWALALGGAAAAQGGTGPADAPSPGAIAPLLRRIAEAPGAKTLEDAARDLPAALAAAPDDAARAAAARSVRENALAARGRLAARLRKDVESAFRSRAAALKQELARRRESALGLIQDEAAYPEGPGGKAAQPRVDEKVAAVRELWENPLRALARMTPSLGKDLDALNAAVDALLRTTGADPAAPLSLEAAFADPGPLAESFRAAPADGVEKKALDHNARVRAALDARKDLPPEIREQIAITNAYRELLGRRAFEPDAALCRAAQVHSEAMARKKALWHKGEDGEPASRVAAEKFEATAVAENVCGTVATPAEAHAMWYGSPGHHRSLVNATYTHLGVGVKDGYWTQVFARGKSKR